MKIWFQIENRSHNNWILNNSKMGIVYQQRATGRLISSFMMKRLMGKMRDNFLLRKLTIIFIKKMFKICRKMINKQSSWWKELKLKINFLWKYLMTKQILWANLKIINSNNSNILRKLNKFNLARIQTVLSINSRKKRQNLLFKSLWKIIRKKRY